MAVAMTPARDAGRLRAIVDTHIDAIARALRRLGVPECDVDDAVQQVFLTVSRRQDDIEEHAVKAFLYKTAIHVAAHARRTLARRREAGDEHAFAAVDGSPGADELLERSRAVGTLNAILESMPESLRTVFVLFEVEQLSVGEIAGLIDVPVGTAASRLRRAREDFQDRVGRVRARMKREV